MHQTHRRDDDIAQITRGKRFLIPLVVLKGHCVFWTSNYCHFLVNIQQRRRHRRLLRSVGRHGCMLLFLALFILVLLTVCCVLCALFPSVCVWRVACGDVDVWVVGWIDCCCDMMTDTYLH